MPAYPITASINRAGDAVIAIFCSINTSRLQVAIIRGARVIIITNYRNMRASGSRVAAINRAGIVVIAVGGSAV